MDRIELAGRRFRQLPPVSGEDHRQKRWLRAVEIWLRDDVVAAVEEFVGRPAFQERARWPLRRLVRGADTPERRAIEDVDAALVTAARALGRFADEDAIDRALRERFPRQERVPDRVVSRGTGPDEASWTSQEIDHLDMAGNPVRIMASRPWSDLVCPHDYLGPRGGLMRTTPLPPGVTEGEFVLAYNPELHPIGDFLTRCLFRRIDIGQAYLNTFRRFCLRAWDRAGRPPLGSADEEGRAWQDLEDRIAELRSLCLAGPEAALRDSCIVLTQVYLAYHPRPDLPWLGLATPFNKGEARLLQHHITRSRTSEPLDRIALALADLNRLPGDSPPRRIDRNPAIDAGGLVLIDQPRTAFWERKPIEADWDRHPKPWEFLRRLAEKGRRAGAVREADLYADVPSPSAMANRFHRLKKLLPPSLWTHIVPAGSRAYRLVLDPVKIHLFDAS